MTARPALVLLTPGGLPTARRIAAALPGCALHLPARHAGLAPEARPFADLAALLARLHRAGQPIVALCASAIVIRLLAPLLADKQAEPPVLAVAEDGSAVVPLLGGHRGANRLARAIADALGVAAAITTAGEVRFGLALDDPPPGWRLANPDAAKAVMAALLAGEGVRLEEETVAADWLRAGGLPLAPDAPWRLLATVRAAAGDGRCLVYHPQALAVGVGCERDTDPAELIGLVEAVLADHRLSPQAVACIASLALKAAEPAIHALAERLGVPARFFEADRLEAEADRLARPSTLVFEATGCHGVAEGAALAAVGPAGTLLVAKSKSTRATCAIAQAPRPLDPAAIGRPQGRLALVGLGPGQPAWRTPEAEALLLAAEDWVGYGAYLDLAADLAHAGIRQHRFALGEEEARARAALDLAAAGRRVALLCSGDPQIYAMASLVHELLDRAAEPAWQRVALDVSPGISALQAAAARAGAPLGHDFCAISLSDLLTPWPEIERRLDAAARGDFVTALYNPASARRRRGLARALAILGASRPAETPVILARQLGRPGEQVTITPLAAFAPDRVDMLSIVIVGSSRSRLVEGLHGRRVVYTPRGYLPAEAAAS